jgi:hypothetical protein
MAAQGRRPASRKKIKRQKAKIKRQKSLSRAVGRIGEGSSRSERKQLATPWNPRGAQRMGL